MKLWHVKLTHPMYIEVTRCAKKEHVLSCCKQAAGTSAHVERVPFETPVSIDATTQYDRDSVVAYKADGVRFYLCLTFFEGKPIACFVNRDEKVYEVDVRAPSDMFLANSVFDGELCTYLADRSQKLYLVFNTLLDRGISYFARPYRSRLACISRSFLSTPLSPAQKERTTGFVISGHSSLHIIAKPYEQVCHIGKLLSIRSTMFATDGLVITPLQDSMTTGRNRRILKYKHVHTIDVVAVCASDKPMELWAADHGTPVPLSDVIVCYFEPDALFDSVVRGATLCHALIGKETETPYVFKEIVEMAMHPEHNTVRLTYVTLRRDKRSANDALTIRRTLDSALCGVNERSLVDVYTRPE